MIDEETRTWAQPWKKHASSPAERIRQEPEYRKHYLAASGCTCDEWPRHCPWDCPKRRPSDEPWWETLQRTGAVLLPPCPRRE